ncbi:MULTISPECIES: hypothetical protein [Bacteroides]|uniref:hypothetical protein n=1 Tax=Bacteroides TaxID=816 RepID=UPI0001BEEA53|nr:MULTISPECIES: hypothetical protein [Bacteroides]MBP7194071.1 hypothetical protein [Bacteroides sp.]EFA21940.1 hypothetical protein HMPREF0969_01135 [Bacteroides sp. D20]MBE7612276.1 hypothetical protein [Bacteroides uniformis]MBE7617469.1 hypothetical protein [Bacteroides uniformis]MBP9618791.1 hypothetical protein [Bacteroides sp.]
MSNESLINSLSLAVYVPSKECDMVVDNVHVLQFFSETNHFHCDSVYRALKDMRYKVVRIKDIKEDLSDFAGYKKK